MLFCYALSSQNMLFCSILEVWRRGKSMQMKLFMATKFFYATLLAIIIWISPSSITDHIGLYCKKRILCYHGLSFQRMMWSIILVECLCCGIMYKEFKKEWVVICYFLLLSLCCNCEFDWWSVLIIYKFSAFIFCNSL